MQIFTAAGAVGQLQGPVGRHLGGGGQGLLAGAVDDVFPLELGAGEDLRRVVSALEP